MNATTQVYAARLSERPLPALLRDLPPDAATSRALALALLAAQCAPEPSPDLEAEIHLLPAFIDAAQDRGSEDDLLRLVRQLQQAAQAQGSR